MSDDPDWLADREPVIALQIGDDARAYPLQIMTWHEIVNDIVGGEPVIVTFCPLCNSAIVFERRMGDTVNSFGVSGLLRYSDLIMYDRDTDSWWQQILGEAIVGELTGTRLPKVPASIISWADFRQNYPDGQVLTRDTGFTREYGRNPYTGYDDIDSSPFLFVGPEDGRLRPVERVAAVELGGESVAYPFLRLEETPVVNDDIGGTPVVVLFSPGTTSALDGSVIAASRDVGATGVYDRRLGDQTLTFRPDSRRLHRRRDRLDLERPRPRRRWPPNRRDPHPHSPRQPLLVRLGRLPTRNPGLDPLTPSRGQPVRQRRIIPAPESRNPSRGAGPGSLPVGATGRSPSLESRAADPAANPSKGPASAKLGATNRGPLHRHSDTKELAPREIYTNSNMLSGHQFGEFKSPKWGSGSEMSNCYSLSHV